MLLSKSQPPTSPWFFAGRIKPPLEQVGCQDLKTTFEFVVFTSTERLKLLPDMLPIEVLPLA
jgi:hypothetical protein